MTKIVTILYSREMNTQALDEQLRAISGDCEGFVYDGKEIRINFAHTPSEQDLAAISEAVENHDAARLSQAQQKEILQTVQLAQLNRKFPQAVEPAKADLAEIAERLRRIELVLGLAGQIASGIEASAGDSGLVG